MNACIHAYMHTSIPIDACHGSIVLMYASMHDRNIYACMNACVHAHATIVDTYTQVRV